MSDVLESRLDEMASKIALLEEEVAGLKKRMKNARKKARKDSGAAGGAGAGAGKRRKAKDVAE